MNVHVLIYENKRKLKNKRGKNKIIKIKNMEK